MKVTKKILLLLIVAVALSGCYKSYIDDSASSGTTRVFLHVDWDNNLHTGDVAPTNYALFLDDTEYAMSANPVDTLLPSGQGQELLVYNNPMGMIVSNGVATLAEATRVATNPEQHPGNLYYGREVIDLVSNSQSELGIPTKRGTAPLTVNVAYDMTKLGEIKGDIIATLSGVAATRNMLTDSLSDAVNFATTVTLDAAASEFVMTFNILGVVGNSQVITFDVVDINGNPTTLTADITADLADFNADMEPLEVDATLSIPNARWLLSNITSTHFPSGTVWTIEADTETPTLEEFDSLNHVLRNVITTDGSINLTLTKATTIPDGTDSPGKTSAFIDCDALKSISLPDATSLGSSAFTICSSLTDVNAPNVTTIGNHTFETCNKLTNLTLDFDNITEVPRAAFYHCYKLTELNFPNVTKIGINAFSTCVELTSLTLGDVTEIPEGAFDWCESLTDLSLPNVTKIGERAFRLCYSLKNLTLDFENITEIPEHAFSQCSSLTELSFPNATKIGVSAFEFCSKLETLTLDFDNITKIERSSFENCKSLTSLNFPEVDSVGEEAFLGCESLASLTLGKATKIDPNVFVNCTALTTLNIGTELTTAPADADIIINTGAFTLAPVENITLTVGYGAKDGILGDMTWIAKTGLEFDSFKEVIAPNTKKWLLSEITSTHYPSGTEWLIEADTEAPTLANFDSLRFVLDTRNGIITEDGSINLTLTKATAIPDGNSSTSAFIECDALKSISLPAATSLGSNALQNCSYITEVNAPNVTEIGESAFAYCGRLTNLTLGNITEIRTKAFLRCVSLTELNFPNVTILGLAAFSDCANLESITLGKATKIDSYAFANCDELTTVNIGTELTAAPAEADIIVDSDAFEDAPVENITLTVGYGTASGEAGNMNWTAETGSAFGGFEEVVAPNNKKWLLSEITSTNYPSGTEWTIEADTETPTFANFDSLRHVLRYVITAGGSIHLTLTKATIIPDGSGTSNSDWTGAFYGCNTLKSISLPAATRIGDGAMREASNITELNAPNVTSIGERAFNACRNLATLTLDFENITEIPDRAFLACYSLTELNFPNVATIGVEAFMGCRRLNSITLDFNNITEIATGVFLGCSELTEANYPNVSTIGMSAFNGCTKLNSVNIEGATEIVELAFIDCSALTEVNFPNVTTIGLSAFNGCTMLNSVNIEGATEIGGYAFKDCSALTEVNFPNVITVDPNVFSDCTNLETATLGKASEIGPEIFSGCTALTTVNIGTELTATPTSIRMGAYGDTFISPFDGAPVGNIILTVGYGTVSGTSPNMTWTPKDGGEPLTGFNSVVEDFNY